MYGVNAVIWDGFSLQTIQSGVLGLMRTESPCSLLSAYRVLDLCDDKGMFAGKILADMGADVIKIEKPGGDPVRKRGPFYGDIPDPEKSLFWFAYNNGKRGMTLDVSTSKGRDLFKKLVKTVDVFLESFPVGYLKEIGLGYEELSAVNDQLVMVSISPFGQTGPYSRFKGDDLIVSAMGGLMQVCGDEDLAPLPVGFPQAYLAASLDAVEAVLVALWARPQIGKGQYADVSAREGVIFTESEMVPYWTMMGQNPSRHGRRVQRPGGVTSPVIWKCKDGYINYIIQAGQPGAERNIAMVKWLEEEGFATDYLKGKKWHEFDWRKTKQEEMDLIIGPLQDFFMSHTREELYTEALKRVISLVPVTNAEFMVNDLQLLSRKFWVELEHPELNKQIIYPGPFAKMTETPLDLRWRAPRIGEHNEEIYVKELGISHEELSSLKESGII
jgi:crotonobetainyl-CoA:carnitine CoA-transferase CaiB-like acyl-CoA transferase